MNTTIKVLNYIATEKYGASNFFNSTDTVQDMILKDYEQDRFAWREEARV